MSFIFQDKFLIDSLIKAGISSLEKYGAKGDSSTYGLAQKLIVDLQRQIDPKNAPEPEPPLTSGNHVTPEIKPANLRNLGDFVKWMADSKLEWNKKRFAWTADEYKNNPDLSSNGAIVFDAYTSDRTRDANRQPTKSDVYILKPEMLAVLTYLRDSKEYKTNRVFRVMLGNAIDQFNSYLEPGENRLEKQPISQDIDSNIVVDGFDVLDNKNPLNGIENWNNNFQMYQFKLKVSDINSNFKDWINHLHTYNNDNNPDVVYSKDVDHCLVVHSLYQRAMYLANTVGNSHDKDVPGYSKAAKLYLAKIVEVGKTYVDKDGKPCSVTSPTTSTTDANKPGTSQEDSSQSKLTREQLSLISEIVNKLPLDQNFIDLNKIRDFTELMRKFADAILNTNSQRSSEFNQSVTTLSNDINDTITNNKKIMRDPNLSRILLSSNLDHINGLLNNGILNAMVFIENMMQLHADTMQLISQFASVWDYTLSPPQKDKLAAQGYIKNLIVDKITSWADVVHSTIQGKK
jgi:hypothetical protein